MFFLLHLKLDHISFYTWHRWVRSYNVLVLSYEFRLIIDWLTKIDTRFTSHVPLRFLSEYFYKLTLVTKAKKRLGSFDGGQYLDLSSINKWLLIPVVSSAFVKVSTSGCWSFWFQVFLSSINKWLLILGIVQVPQSTVSFLLVLVSVFQYYQDFTSRLQIPIELFVSTGSEFLVLSKAFYQMLV